MPTMDWNDKIIVHLRRIQKFHTGIIVGYILAAYLQEKYPQYKYTRATVVFPDKEPFPEDFVKKICEMFG